MPANKASPRFTIVIPTYNCAQFLRRCLDSTVEQSFSDFEVVVVNNYSEDDTIEIVESYRDPRVRLINFRNHGIIAASRNVGIEEGSGEFVAFLDADDWWYPEKLAVVNGHLGEADVVYHDLDIYRPSGKARLRKCKGRVLTAPVYVDLLVNGNRIPNSSAVAKRSVIIAAGGLSESKELVAVEDYDLWLQIARRTDEFRYVSQSLGAYWVGSTNVSEASERQIGRTQALYDKNSDLLSGDQAIDAERFLHYGIGRTWFEMRQFRQSIPYLQSARRASNRIIRVKAAFARLAAEFGLAFMEKDEKPRAGEEGDGVGE